jgi:protoheme IX farnesyltransferase
MNAHVTSIATAHRSVVARSMLVRAGDYLALTKPRVMSLVVFTALVGLLSAPAAVHPADGFIAIICIAAGAGSAATLNMWYDADIDAMMRRTAGRPIPQGRVRPAEALAFGLTLAAGSVALFGLLINIAAAGLLALTIAFYVLVYTAWLKRSSAHNIVIGGAAGAFPPMIGWAAATGGLSAEPLSLFLIIVFWTPPHFWALSLYRTDDYARAGVPMLPVVAGKARTRQRILIYTLLLVLVSILPWAVGFVGVFYGAFAILAGAKMIVLAWQLQVGGEKGERAAKRLFVFSIAYLFLLFAAFLVDKQVTANLALKLASQQSHHGKTRLGDGRFAVERLLAITGTIKFDSRSSGE